MPWGQLSAAPRENLNPPADFAAHQHLNGFPPFKNVVLPADELFRGRNTQPTGPYLRVAIGAMALLAGIATVAATIEWQTVDFPC